MEQDLKLKVELKKKVRCMRGGKGDYCKEKKVGQFFWVTVRSKKGASIFLRNCKEENGPSCRVNFRFRISDQDATEIEREKCPT